MTELKKIILITNRNIDDSSTQAMEIKNIYEKWGKQIDEGFGTVLQWKIATLLLITILILINFNYLTFPDSSVPLLYIILMVSIYFYSKRTWYREGFYDGYDTGSQDASSEVIEKYKIIKKNANE